MGRAGVLSCGNRLEQELGRQWEAAPHLSVQKDVDCILEGRPLDTMYRHRVCGNEWELGTHDIPTAGATLATMRMDRERCTMSISPFVWPNEDDSSLTRLRVGLDARDRGQHSIREVGMDGTLVHRDEHALTWVQFEASQQARELRIDARAGARAAQYFTRRCNCVDGSCRVPAPILSRLAGRLGGRMGNPVCVGQSGCQRRTSSGSDVSGGGPRWRRRRREGWWQRRRGCRWLRLIALSRDEGFVELVHLGAARRQHR
eukprot:2887511-Prymnesium_polylepis.3